MLHDDAQTNAIEERFLKEVGESKSIDFHFAF